MKNCSKSKDAPDWLYFLTRVYLFLNNWTLGDLLCTLPLSSCGNFGQSPNRYVLSTCYVPDWLGHGWGRCQPPRAHAISKGLKFWGLGPSPASPQPSPGTRHWKKEASHSLCSTIQMRKLTKTPHTPVMCSRLCETNLCCTDSLH